MSNARRCLWLLPLIATISGCLYEMTLDDKGGGVITARYRIAKRDFSEARSKMQSASVKLVSSEIVGQGDTSEGVFKMSFDDVTKLSTAPHFNTVSVTRADGKEGTKVLTAKVRHDRPITIPENMLDRFGREVKVVVTFPGEVSESNGTISDGKTVTWTWGLNQFYEAKELLLTATYQSAAAAAAKQTAASGSPTAAAGTPTAAAKAQPTQRAEPRGPKKPRSQ